MEEEREGAGITETYIQNLIDEGEDVEALGLVSKPKKEKKKYNKKK